MILPLSNCVNFSDLLSALIPSTKCSLPGRNVYHWRRRRNNRRWFPSFTFPCLPLSFSSLPLTRDTLFLPLPPPYPFIPFLTSPSPSLSTSSPQYEGVLLCRLPDFRKPHTHSGCLCYLGSYTTAIYNPTHYSQSTRLSRHVITFLSLSCSAFKWTIQCVLGHVYTNGEDFENQVFPVFIFSSTLDKKIEDLMKLWVLWCIFLFTPSP